jgi:predicted ATPase
METQVFVARERELGRLRVVLDRALAGRGQVCFVAGVAGAGKTALVTEFARQAQAAHRDLVVAIGNCNAHTGIGDSYLPFREILALLLGDTEAKLSQGAITPENAKRLGALLVRSGQVLVEIAPDLIDTLVPGGKLLTLVGKALVQKFKWLDELEREVNLKRETPAGVEPVIQQSRIFEQYANVLRELAAHQPLMLILDDLQWADAASISLLFHLSRRIEDRPILLVGTYRTDEVALGRGGERHPLEPVINEVKRTFGDVLVDLGAESEAEAKTFVNSLLDTEPNRLGEGFRTALLQHTQGHPLFTIELLRHLQADGDLIHDESGRWIEGPALDWDALPARVEGVIAERIGRLEAGLREVLSVASVEGEDFTVEVVARVRRTDERELIRRLRAELDKQHHLVGELGVRQLGKQRLCFYEFRHNLFQRYLYNALAEGERAYLHEDVGTILETLYKDRTEEIAVHLAWHFEEAGLLQNAVTYLLQAANRAIRISANQEAIGHLNKASALLEQFPESVERTQQELQVQLALGVALTATQGYSAPDVAKVFTRARELCRQLGDTVQLFPALHGLWRFHNVRAEHHVAGELGEQLLRLAEEAEDTHLLLEAHWARGVTMFWLGQVDAARAAMEQSLALYDAKEHSGHALIYGQDPCVVTLSFLGWSLALLGFPDQALQRVEEAVARAETVAHPFSIGFGLHCAAIVQALRREGQATEARTSAEIALSNKHGFPFWSSGGTTIQGWAMAQQGKTEDGIAQLRQGFAGWVGTGAELARTYYLGLLADACWIAQQTEAGLAAVSEALAAADSTGEQFYAAELHRLQGELLLQQSNGASHAAGEAETALHKAWELAKSQGVRLFELRAAMSLLRFYRAGSSQQVGEFRQTLADIVQWFTEGDATADLQEANALLLEGT